MMALFGVEEWCERGEIFSVYFGMFSQLGSVRPPRRPAGLRRPLSAATQLGDVPVGRGRHRLDLLTSFDGAQEGASKAQSKVFRTASPTWASADDGPTTLRHVFLAATFAGVGRIYVGGIRGMRGPRARPR